MATQDATYQHDDPPAFFKSPASQNYIDKYRESAGTAAWPKNVLIPLGCDQLQADRDGHEAQVLGDVKAVDAAIMRRWDAAGRLDSVLGQISDSFVSEISIAMARDPETVCRLLGIDVLADRIANLEAAVAGGLA